MNELIQEIETLTYEEFKQVYKEIEEYEETGNIGERLIRSIVKKYRKDKSDIIIVSNE